MWRWLLYNKRSKVTTSLRGAIKAWLFLLIVFVIPLCVDAQVALVSSYFNDGSQNNEWTELLVVQDDLDLNNYTLRDNNLNQNSWMTPITFSNGIWSHLRSGTIILIWHRRLDLSNNLHPLDVNKSDGFIEVHADDPTYFSGGDFPNNTLNIAAAGDVLQLRTPSGTHVHAIGHKAPAGTDWAALPFPKLNHLASLNSTEVLMVCPGTTLNEYGWTAPQNGTTYTSRSATLITKGLPNECTASSTSNLNYWRGLRQPQWTSPSLSGIFVPASTINLSWNAATDPYPADNTQGYILLRNTVNTFTDPTDGHTYSVGDNIGGATVVGIINSSQTLTFSDNFSPSCGDAVYYRIYAFRYSIDNSNINDLNLARGTAYNEASFGAATVTRSVLPSVFAVTGNTSYCSGTTGVPVGLSGSETGMSYQLYIDCPAPNTPVGPPTSGTGSSISFGNQTIPGSGPCTFTVLAYATGDPACSSPMSPSLTVSVIPTPAFSISSSDPTTCGGNEGTITLTGLSPNTSFSVSYVFNGSPVGPLTLTSSVAGAISLIGLSAGAYTNIVVTFSGCASAPGSVSLNDPPIPSPPVISSPSNAICSGQSVTLTATGCTGTLTWSPGGETTTSITVSPGSNTTYSATCLVAGCLSLPSNSITISVTLSPVIGGITASNPTSCGSNTGSFTISGLIPSTLYSITYLYNGSPVGPLSILSDAGGNITISSLFAGSYTDIIVSLNGCPSAPVSINLFDPGSPAAPSITASVTAICEGQSVDLTATGCMGSITWSNGATGALITVSPVTTTSFSATCTEIGCTSAPSNSITIIVYPIPSAPTVSASSLNVCSGQATTLTASGCTGALLWSTGETTSTITVTPSTPSTYTVTCTENGCTSSGGNINIGINPGPAITNVSFTNSACGNNNGTITIIASGVSPPLQYSIDNGISWSFTGNFSNLAPGNYTVLVKDNNGCQSSYASNPVTISTIGGATLTSVTSTPSTCSLNNGSISFVASGGTGTLEYSINGGSSWQTSPNFGNLVPGSYTLLVRDANNCQTPYASNPVIIADLSGASITSVSITDATCGLSDGSINIIISGGAVPVSYSIDNGVTWSNSGVFNSLSAGTYQVAVKDGNNCQTVYSANPISVLSVGGAMINSVITTNETCGSGNATISIVASGGILPPEFSIDNGATWIPSGSFSGLSAGSYQILVRDNAGCQTVYLFNPVVIINEPGADFVTVNVSNANCELQNGVIRVLTNGGTAPLQLSIDNGSSWIIADSVAGLSAGQYNVVIKDSNNCVTSYTGNPLQIIDIPKPTVKISDADTLCSGIQHIFTPGGSFASYRWQDGSSGTSFTATEPGEYWVTVSDTYGCQVTDRVWLLPCSFSLRLPTAFSPNRDGFNEIFRAITNEADKLTDFEMLVYDKWGQLLFQSAYIYVGWDGTFKGRICPNDVYTYVIRYDYLGNTSSRKPLVLRGQVAIVR